MTYSQSLIVGRATYNNEFLREHVLAIGVDTALRGASAAGHTVLTDDDGNVRSEHHWDHFEEYPALCDEDGEPLVDEDSRIIDDTSQPKIPFSRLTIDLPITEGSPS